MDFDTVMRSAGGFDGAQPREPPDAVIDVDDEVAGGEAGDLGDEILGATRRSARAHETVAEDVLLADHRGLGGLEAAFEFEHGERNLRLGQHQRLRPRRHRRKIGQPMIGEHMAHALARALAPQRHHHALAGALQRADMPGHRLEHVASGLGALGREITSLSGTGIDHRPLPLGHRKRREPRQRRAGKPCGPFRLGEMKPVGRQRSIGRTGFALGQRLLARVIIVLDLDETLAGGVVRQRLEHDRRSRQIVEQCREAVVKQRQPMLHAGMAAALAHRMIEEIIGPGRAERLHIAEAEALDGFGGQLKLGHRDEIEAAQLVGRALALGIEAADGLQRVAEKIEPYRLGQFPAHRDR